jgi:ligand-binding sensor domain-containing protein
MYWRRDGEAWFATRSGAAQLADKKVRVFTENDGLESELITDIGPGEKNEVWVATRRGTGRFDGTRWQFPKMGPFYLPAHALGWDGRHVFIGTDKGLYCVGDCAPDAIRGLLDEAVLDLAVDVRGRVWVLTAKGISVVDP